MAGQPKKRAKLAALNAKTHDTAQPPPGAIPMSQASQELKDARAAMSVVMSPLDPHQQLVDLYPEAKNMDREGRRRFRMQTTQSERVKAILADDAFEIERHRKSILRHMVDIALDRSDRDGAIRATSLLAKIGGWLAPTKIEGTTKTFSIQSMLSNPDEIKAALAMMSHEPGAAVAIQSDARDDYERRHGKMQDAIESEIDGP